MTDEAKALVERLREENEWTNQRPYFHAHSKCLEAADLIETQDREIERLREALGKICRDSNPDWTQKRAYPNDALDEIHTIAVNAYYGESHD